MRVARVSLPRNPVRIEEDARPRLDEKFVDLTTDISHINVGGPCVAHIDGMVGSGIHDDICRASRFPFRTEPPAATPEEFNMRRHDEIVVIGRRKLRKHRFYEGVPGSQPRRDMRIIEHGRTFHSEKGVLSVVEQISGFELHQTNRAMIVRTNVT